MKKQLLILTLVATVLGVSTLHLVPFFIPFCFAWLFNELDNEKTLKPVLWKTFLFAFIYCFLTHFPLMMVIEKYFNFEPYQSYIGYVGYSFFQSLAIVIAVGIAYLINHYFILRKSLRYLNYAFMIYFINAIYPYVIELKLSFSILKFNIPIVQFADTIGFLGLDLVLHLIAVVILLIYQSNNSRLEKSLIALVVFISFNLLGLFYKKGFNNYDTQLNTLSIQSNLPSFPELFKKDPKNYVSTILSTNYNLTKANLKKEHDLVLWTETEIPFFYNNSATIFEVNKVSSFIYSEVQTPLIAGTMYSLNDKDVFFYNSAVYINKNGSINGFHHKRHLMPLSEKRDLGWIDFNPLLKTIETEVEYKGPVTPFILKKGDKDIKILTLICYEATLSKVNFDFNPDVIVILSNDYFFRGTPVILDMINYMMAARAVEFRKPLIRTARIGPSSSTNANGNMFAKSHIDESLGMSTTVNIKMDRPPTFYYKTRHHQHFVIIFVWLIFLFGANLYIKNSHSDTKKEL